MMENHQLPKYHQGLTQRCWENIRRSMARCLKNDRDRIACIDWCKEANQPTRKIWQEILEGRHPDRTRQIFETEYFFDLPTEQLNWWENHVQNHSFVVIFAWENYRKLKTEREA